MNLKIFTDGGAKGNPGPAAVGVVIRDQNGKLVSQFGQKIGIATNNVAEYRGVIEALKYLKQHPIGKIFLERVDFYLDSKLVVQQLKGVFKVKNPRLRELLLKVRSLEQEVGSKCFYHFQERERNSAHYLVEKALLGYKY